MAKKDEFSQIGYLYVVESAAGTLTFAGLSVFSNILEPKGLVMHRIQYRIAVGYTLLMTTDSDQIIFGITGSDTITSVALNDPQVYDYQGFYRRDFGTAASGFLNPLMHETDFTKLPGGGILVPADRVYAFVQATGLASAIAVEARFHFTILDLTAQQYLELAQSLRVLT